MDRSGPALSLPGLEVEVVESPVVYARFDLLWNLLENGGELILDCTYNSDLFNPQAIRRWMEKYEALLRKIAADQTETSLEEMVKGLEATEERQRAAETKDLKEAGQKKLVKTQRKSIVAVET
jgi:hypothetical protein